MTDQAEKSPQATFVEYLRQGKLAYQFSPFDQAVIFPPKLMAGRTGLTDLEWRISAGNGTVYATTVAAHGSGAPYNIAMIELDEGFRMLSRVETIAPEHVAIGMRVELRVEIGSDADMPVPVFHPMEITA